ncbi:hypothetical protein BJ170DRAFT_489368 [Xylariales sp. AK1849]|nr:hypothetical protein BJ170DRAFT_489368 [Xylariales sp. AK1849]
MAGYNQAGGNDPNEHLNAMLARLTGGRNAANASDEPSPSPRDLLSRYATLNQANQTHHGYYPHQSEDQESPSDLFPPPAPTPPMSHFPHSHGPPGMMGMSLGPIGTLPHNNANKPDQSASLLSLLKYNSGGGSGPSTHSSAHSHSNSHSQTSPVGPPQYSSPFDGASNPPVLHAPVPMPVDPHGILADLMNGNSNSEAARPEQQANSWNAAPPSEDAQAYLLNLLQRKKPEQNDKPSTNESSQPATLTPQSTAHESATDQARDFQVIPRASETAPQDAMPMPYSFMPQQHHAASPPARQEYGSPASQTSAARKSNMFDYNNPFDELASSSPRNRTPKSTTSGVHGHGTAASGVQILKKAPSAAPSPSASDHHKHLSSNRSSAMSPEQFRQSVERQSPAAFGAGRSHESQSTEHIKEPVSVAVGNLAELCDQEAQDALSRAENEQAQAASSRVEDEEAQARIVRDLEDMMDAQSEADFEEKSEIAARDIKKELDKQENAGVLEESFSPEVAQAVRDIVDEAANGHLAVADSWESAEADEIVVIEEVSTPVKVYNFPMKPWISITLQDNEEPRPQFRDEVILDIARVKKEFDQIDRNLVSATETYIIYGMSKAGGLRVIRQDDGRDAKLFTDTKDRIFNIAVSSTPADLNTTQKESIIGTGISGTVYYVLIKNGDKDYLDDAHPEQYGFALSPMSTQEGDAPGGVLKTRARTSSTHPEYFAVGRGKTISIIWPSYVMQHNLFKPGHDRVVDTEKLSKQCSLRINTGKAGKDFTFSQDDTTIVSLDKSGRVKFWDVRDLTAPDEGSDSRFPTPAQTSLEVKEPLMTLTTTPEGEKAWPTSVLLLDKQRPYQKRCALRYMIVGMKQNHTLQLWDLALGKPVQEFNLPHSKESDAVCSVMYHPPTGMIVVGHPTRNSIYFLHLSAPKYTIKGLSQVDYIQKLVAKDSSIPEPDSTAVISGVREYSFSNKGVIRSLDMLTNPAASSDDDEQTLFELYAMHSKGVSGICVKQSELGWTKDNKVLAPVDAVTTGIVTINKLKDLPNQPSEAAQPIEETINLPIRTTTRSSKENASPLAQPTSSDDAVRKVADEKISLNNIQAERKLDAPVTPINQIEKSERKSRKKKDKAAAAEKNSLAADQSNGNLQSTNAGSASAKHVESKPSYVSSQPAMSSDFIPAALKQVETSVNSAVDAALREHRQKVDSEIRGRDAAFKKGQETLLDLVSTTLDDNVQKVLTRTISDKVEDNVVPALEQVIRESVSEQMGRVVSEQLDTKISGRISHAIQNQMQKLLPAAVSQALQKPDLAKAVTDKISHSLAADVEKSFHDTLNKTITPAFSRMAVAAASEIANEVQEKANLKIEVLEKKLRADENKIDQLAILVTRLNDTVASMAANQAEFQVHYQKLQERAARDSHSHSHAHAQSQPQPQTVRQAHYSQSTQASHAPPQTFAGQASFQQQPYASPSAHSGNQLMSYPSSGSGRHRDQDLERKIADVASQVDRGEIEGALVRWLQSDRKDDIFKEYLAKLDMSLFQDLSPLVSLAVIAELARDLNDDLLRERVGWVQMILAGLHGPLPHIDNQVREVMPSILNGFLGQMEGLATRINAHQPNHPILPFVYHSIKMAREIIAAAQTPNIRDY